MTTGTIHTIIGYIAVLAPLLALAGVAGRNRTLTRVAPIMLDVALLFGIIAIATGRLVNWAHPALMLGVVIAGHVLSRREGRPALIGWSVILVVMLVGILFARGAI
ncbi:MAG TPA: hypothetical protein VNT60_10970 [Deinococcales bacterium]|nr:hypothetical protein [Deinococcales bacterium]